MISYDIVHGHISDLMTISMDLVGDYPYKRTISREAYAKSRRSYKHVTVACLTSKTSFEPPCNKTFLSGIRQKVAEERVLGGVTSSIWCIG